MVPFAHALWAQKRELYDLDRIVEVKLEMDDKHWHKKLMQYKRENSGDRTLATLYVDGVKYDSVGVRFKGNSSYYAAARKERRKLPFNIKVNHTDKEQMVDGEFRTLKLSNLFRDPSYVREALSYAIAGEYMAAPRCNYARLIVDGEYLGLYNLTESIDERFWETRFDTPQDEGLLFKCDPESKEAAPADCPDGIGASLKYLGEDSLCYAARYEIKKSDHGWHELLDLTKQLNDPGQEPEDFLNVDEALWMLAFNNAMVNLDSYLGMFCHNYYLFRDNSGYWRPVIWDLNLSFGGFRLLAEDEVLDDEELKKMSPFLHFSDKNPDRPLITHLFSRPLFRKMYVAHLKTIYDEQFADKQWEPRAEALRRSIQQLVADEPFPLYPAGNFEQNYITSVKTTDGSVVGLRELIDGRTDYLAGHPLFKKPPPAIADHGAVHNGDSVTVSVTLAEGVAAEAVWVAHRPAGTGGFHYAPATAEADGTYAVSLPASDIGEYFLVAEGRVSATVLPARSGVEWFSISK